MSEAGRELTTLMNAAELVMHGLDGAMADRVAKQWDAKCAEASALRAKIGAIEAEARRYAEMYPQSSDGRNTFVIFADWVASRPAPPVEAKSEVVESSQPRWEVGKNGWDTSDEATREDI